MSDEAMAALTATGLTAILLCLMYWAMGQYLPGF